MIEMIPLGDSALIFRMRERFDDAPEQTLDTVFRAFQQLQNAAIPGVIELAPAYTSVAVFFDPISIAKGAEIPEKVFDWLGDASPLFFGVTFMARTAQNTISEKSKFQSAMIRNSRSTSMMLRDAHSFPKRSHASSQRR